MPWRRLLPFSAYLYITHSAPRCGTKAGLPFIHLLRHRARSLCSPPLFSRSRAAAPERRTVMPVKAKSFVRRRATQGEGPPNVHRCRIPGSGDHRRVAVTPWRFGRYVHAGSTYGVAFPPGGADALLFVRRRPDLFQRRKASGAEPRRYGQYSSGHDALAWCLARPPVLTSGAVGSRRARPGAAWGEHVSDTDTSSRRPKLNSAELVGATAGHRLTALALEVFTRRMRASL